MLTGTAPFYRCYECADGGYVAVGCIEPKFYAAMISLMGIAPETIGSHFDIPKWGEQTELLTKAFMAKPRDEWAALFDGTDACVTPVLDYKEAISHKQVAARNGLTEIDGLVHPAIAPVFQSHSPAPTDVMHKKGADTADVLAEAGLTEAEIEDLKSDSVIV